MAIPTLLLPLNGDMNGQDRNGAVTATSTGALRWQAGHWADPVATINLVPNPRFDPAGTAWTTFDSPTGVSQVQDTATTKDGVPSLKLTRLAASKYFDTTTGHLFAAGGITYSARVWAKCNVASKVLSLILYAWDAGDQYLTYYQGVNTTLSTTDWTEVKVTTAVSSATARLQLYVYDISSGAAGDIIWLTQPQLEKQSAPTAYIDGTLPRGVWNGTPNASSSSRIAAATNQAAFVEEGTTNYLPNPALNQYASGVETRWDTALNGTAQALYGWSTGYNSGVTSPEIGYHAHLSLTAGVNGSPCLEFIDRNTQFGLAKRWMGITIPLDTTFSALLSNGKQVTFSCDLKVSDITHPLDVGLYSYRISTGTQGFGPNQRQLISATQPNVWQRVSTTFTIDSDFDTTKACTLYIYGNSGSVEGDLWVDNVQLELMPYATTYCDGSLGTGYSWSGTAYASSSTRTLSYITLPGVNLATPGALAMWVYLMDDSTHHLWYQFSGAADRVYITQDATALTLSIGAGGAQSGSLVASAKLPVRQWRTLFLEWDGRSISLRDGTTLLLDKKPYTADNNKPTALIGRNSWTPGGANALVGPVMHFDRVLVNDERLTLCQSTKPWAFNTLYPRVAGIIRTTTEAPIALTRVSPPENIT